jgi:hypothetical protein
MGDLTPVKDQDLLLARQHRSPPLSGKPLLQRLLSLRHMRALLHRGVWAAHLLRAHCGCRCVATSRRLLAQPIIIAEIWSNYSPVCDSSDCPSRILFSEVFLEYFSSIGDRWNEFACLFYCLELLFWCMLVL